MTEPIRTTGEASSSATIIPPLGQRTTAEILRAVIEAGYYSGGGTPHNSSLCSDFMCHALNYAAIYEVIAPDEAVQAKDDIKEYMRYLRLDAKTDSATLWFTFLCTPYADFTVEESETLCRITYQDWDNRPKGRHAMTRALETWRTEEAESAAEMGKTLGEPTCED